MKKSEMNNLSRFFCCGYVAQVYEVVPFPSTKLTLPFGKIFLTS